ncbi:MAG: response regulator transcription factor [Pyramidobacter sp.]|nr:response regulator transcription factor [Pyramidobacter sp.]
MIRILIIEFQRLMREALKFSLSSREGFEVVAALGDAACAEGLCGKNQIDVVLMSICAENNFSGIDAAAQIKSASPQTRVLMMSGKPSAANVERARRAGADGFVCKSIGIAELISAIRAVCAGEEIFPDSAGGGVILNSYEVLTEREKEILRLICGGMTRREIAEKLCISENSVKTHFANILSKTGHKSISKLAIYALSHGYGNSDIF